MRLKQIPSKVIPYICIFFMAMGMWSFSVFAHELVHVYQAYEQGLEVKGICAAGYNHYEIGWTHLSGPLQGTEKEIELPATIAWLLAMIFSLSCVAYTYLAGQNGI